MLLSLDRVPPLGASEVGVVLSTLGSRIADAAGEVVLDAPLPERVAASLARLDTAAPRRGHMAADGASAQMAGALPNYPSIVARGVESVVKRNPVGSVLAALGVGLMLGLMQRR